MTDEDSPRLEPRACCRGKLRRWSVRLLVLLVSLIVTGGLLEFFLRAADPFGISYYQETNRYLNESVEILAEAARPDGRLFQNRAGGEVEFRAFTFAVNGAGVRSHATDDGFDLARDSEHPKAFRILFLGDSVTLAWGVEDEDSWIRIVEREARAPDGRPLECLNAGHLQYNTIQEADWLAANGPALRPDLVVLTYVVNDLDDAYAMYLSFIAAVEAAKTADPGPLEKTHRWWRGNFPGMVGLMRVIEERWAVRTADAEAEAVPVDERPEYAAGWARSRSGLERMHELCIALDAPLLILDNSVPRIPAVAPWCKAQDIPWYDLTFTPEEEAQEIRNSLADAHANPLGNRFLADKALRALVDAGFVIPAGD
jgi:hypothetical protein